MLSGLERFLQQHAHIVAGLEAISTFGVVVVSLGLALLSNRANRTGVDVVANFSSIRHRTLEKPRRYLTVKHNQ